MAKTVKEMRPGDQLEFMAVEISLEMVGNYLFPVDDSKFREFILNNYGKGLNSYLLNYKTLIKEVFTLVKVHSHLTVDKFPHFIFFEQEMKKIFKSNYEVLKNV